MIATIDRFFDGALTLRGPDRVTAAAAGMGPAPAPAPAPAAATVAAASTVAAFREPGAIDGWPVVLDEATARGMPRARSIGSGVANKFLKKMRDQLMAPGAEAIVDLTHLPLNQFD